MPSSIVRVTPTDYDAWHALHMQVMREHGAQIGMTSEVIYRNVCAQRAHTHSPAL